MTNAPPTVERLSCMKWVMLLAVAACNGAPSFEVKVSKTTPIPGRAPGVECIASARAEGASVFIEVVGYDYASDPEPEFWFKEEGSAIVLAEKVTGASRGGLAQYRVDATARGIEPGMHEVIVRGGGGGEKCRTSVTVGP